MDLYIIYYDNGERFDDSWRGVLEEEGVFSSIEKAKERIKELQKEHDFRIKEEIEQGIIFPSFELEEWCVKPIKFNS